MKHRTWITEALRLHFEEHLPRIVAGHRLGVPKSTGCDMFVRFCNAGLSWPLPVMPAFTENSPQYQLYVLKAPLYPKLPWKKTSPAAQPPL